MNLVKVAATAVPLHRGRHRRHRPARRRGGHPQHDRRGPGAGRGTDQAPPVDATGEPTGPAVLRGLIAKVSPTFLLWALLQRLPDVAEFTNPSSSKGSAE